MTELTPMAIYLIMQADIIQRVLEINTIISFLVIPVGFTLLSVSDDFNDPTSIANTARRLVTAGFSGVLVGMFLCMLMPSSKTLVAMYGVPTAIEAAKGAHLDDTANKAVQAVNKLLDQYLSKE